MYEQYKLIEAQAAYHAKRNAAEAKRERIDNIITGIGAVIMIICAVVFRFWCGL